MDSNIGTMGMQSHVQPGGWGFLGSDFQLVRVGVVEFDIVFMAFQGFGFIINPGGGLNNENNVNIVVNGVDVIRLFGCRDRAGQYPL